MIYFDDFFLFATPQDGWNQSHFITPVSTLERERFKSHPSLSTTNQQMSPVIQSGQSRNVKRFTEGVPGIPFFKLK